MKVENITFEEILPIWKNELWPNRNEYETHSSMNYPYSKHLKRKFDPDVYTTTCYYYAIKDPARIIAVNSGHLSNLNDVKIINSKGETQNKIYFRSRGIWVHPDYRNKGLSRLLFNALEETAKIENADFLWSLPRKQALEAYTAFGFNTVADFIRTHTNESNIYVLKEIQR